MHGCRQKRSGQSLQEPQKVITLKRESAILSMSISYRPDNSTNINRPRKLLRKQRGRRFESSRSESANIR
jgi:hypothetical protein